MRNYNYDPGDVPMVISSTAKLDPYNPCHEAPRAFKSLRKARAELAHNAFEWGFQAFLKGRSDKGLRGNAKKGYDHSMETATPNQRADALRLAALRYQEPAMTRSRALT